MTGFGRRRLGAVAMLLAWVMLMAPGAVSAETSSDSQNPPDQVDPPAEGEGAYLEDPSEPEVSGFTAAAGRHPSPSINLTGRRWRNPGVKDYRASQRYTSAVRASRVGWSRGASSAVLVSGTAPGLAVAASALAGATEGPLLLTKPRQLPDPVRRELRRLSPRRVFIVGAVSAGVAKSVARTGARVTRVRDGDRYATAMAVARLAVSRGAKRHTVVVASGQRWTDNLGVAALAAGREFPVLLAKRSSGRAELARRVRSLGARRVYVAGRRSTISDAVVGGLPGVVRLDGPSGAASGVATARRGYALGLDNRPFVVGAGHWADATAWGAMAGGQRNSVVLPNTGQDLSPSALQWLDDISPARVALVSGESAVGGIARCQISSGRERSWYCAELTLRRQGYHVPTVDGRPDRFSVFAIFAFEKVAGRAAHGSFGNAEWNAMVRNPRMKVRRPDLPKKHVEINIGKQLILLVVNGRVRHHIHTSTGKSSTPTIRGTFTVYEKRPYRQSHNQMYYPIFFHGGYALHGYPSVPTYPASHGCARTYDGNMDFIYPRVNIGDRVHTY